MSRPVLEAEDVRVERGGNVLLDGVSLAVDTETRLLVRGQSGAGKTTFFNTLGLLDVPTSGTIAVEGSDVTTLSEHERSKIRRETLGFVFQEFQLIRDLTAWENAAVPQNHLGRRDEAWLETLFERLGIEHCRDQYPATLSGGEKQRVGIARALANRPSIVLADEPTGQLDPETSEQVLGLLVELYEQTETGLVVVSHDQTIERYFAETRRLEGGRLRDQ